MIFTSFTYIYFFLAVFVLYWVTGKKSIQNYLLLTSSYIFYGWVTPWFCLLIASSTIADYCCGRLMQKFPERGQLLLYLSLGFNLGLLCVFKYFNFFIDNFLLVFSQLGFSPSAPVLSIVLPVGISFYTFQTLSYTIDIYRGDLQARESFIDFAVFVCFFPQLVAGPIERAKNFLPQVEREREWSWGNFEEGVVLILRGFFKKLVIADNLAFFVDKIYMLESPGMLLFAIGTFAFAIQIFTDFSGYTDIARGTARLLGFHLMKNFDFPYFAHSPSDFWRRWHISLSTWIRDYIYIPLGGSRHKSYLSYVLTILATMCLCGLWHGAAWNYVIWGVYHGILLVVYRSCGLGGRWKPSTSSIHILSCCTMFCLTLIGWSIFRAPSMTWWWQIVTNLTLHVDKNSLTTACYILALIVTYYSPLGLLFITRRHSGWLRWGYSPVQACLLLMIIIFHSESGQDFIYFQF